MQLLLVRHEVVAEADNLCEERQVLEVLSEVEPLACRHLPWGPKLVLLGSNLTPFLPLCQQPWRLPSPPSAKLPVVVWIGSVGSVCSGKLHFLDSLAFPPKVVRLSTLDRRPVMNWRVVVKSWLVVLSCRVGLWRIHCSRMILRGF